MLNKIYLQSRQTLVLGDSVYAREINSVFKEAEILLDENEICFVRENRAIRTPISEIDGSFFEDEKGMFIFLGYDLDD